MQGGLTDDEANTGEPGVQPTTTATSTTTSRPAADAPESECPESPTARLVYGTSWTQDDVIVALLTLQVLLLITMNARQ